MTRQISQASSAQTTEPGNLFGLQRVFAVRLLTATQLAVLFIAAAVSTVHAQNVEWPTYANDPGAQRYSPLEQISRANVASLKVAWVYHTGEVSDGRITRMKTGFENTPIVIDGTMYISTPFNNVVALDPATGIEKWRYDPKVPKDAIYSEGLINRGVASWLDPDRKPGDPCRRRIFIATIDARLIALDAANGKLCSDFASGGQIDLRANIKNISRIGYYGEYEETSPPAIIDDLVIVGSAIGDNRAVSEPLGTVRAFDARSGALRWLWDPVPQGPTDPAWKDWKPDDALRTGAGNAWAPISVDAANELVFIPTGSASPDYFGGVRRGPDEYADSLVALNAKSGKLAWYFQTTHHNLWDYDNPCQPLLCSLHRGGEIPAVVQGTKRGELFVFNRLTGEPVFPIHERPVPQSDVPGEETSPTQPFPDLPPPLVPQKVTADDAFGVVFFDRRQCAGRITQLRSEGVFTPPSLSGSLQIPGNTGGMNWSGLAFDPVRQILVTNVNNMPSEVHLIPRSDFAAQQSNSRGFDLEFAPQLGTPYALSRTFMRSRFPGLICTKPPWGSLVAVELASGQIKWTVPLGDAGVVARSLLHIPIPDPHWGLPSLGGAIVTKSGLVFIAGALGDPHFRAFDIDSGELLWSAELPAAGNATPMTYSIDGRQFVVIAAGGHSKFDAKRSDALVAFAIAQ